jgi:hypothetical protein
LGTKKNFIRSEPLEQRFLRLFQRPAVAVVMISLLLMVVIITSNALGISPISWILNRDIENADLVVAYVNHDPVHLGSLELTKATMQFNQPELSDEQAYAAAMRSQIRNLVLVQEANRREITVSETESRQYWEHMQVLIDDHPEMIQMLKEQRSILGYSDEEYEQQIIQAYQDLIAIGKLRDRIYLSAPLPTDEEVELALADTDGRNTLIVLPIYFEGASTARKAYSELQEMSDSMPSDEFEGTFLHYALQSGGRQVGDILHETFVFDELDEIPGYAQSAFNQPEGAIGFFDDEDGSAVIYLVLTSMKTSDEEARAAIYSLLVSEKQENYWLEFENTLIEAAQVEYVAENLPGTARKALLEE